MEVRLGHGKSFYVGDTLIDLVDLRWDWYNSGHSSTIVHDANACYNYLYGEWVLLQNGSEAPKKRADRTLVRYHQLQEFIRQYRASRYTN